MNKVKVNKESLWRFAADLETTLDGLIPGSEGVGYTQVLVSALEDWLTENNVEVEE
jgi:hypothetical protein